MRFRKVPALALLAFVACAAQAGAQEQKQDQRVIEEFVNTRGAGSVEPGKRPRKRSSRSRRSARAAGKSAGSKSPSAAASNEAGAARRGGDGAAATAQGGGQATDDAGAQGSKAGVEGASRALALGYTILLKDDEGRLSVVDPAREFKTGDNIAVVLETNADGYLYMFNASDGKNPEMLFPNVQLDGGANSITAHARATFPADPSLDFRFTDPPAREHLFVVFSREPLAGVPTGEALVEFCGPNTDECSWKPPAQLWERIRSGARGRGVTEAKNMQPTQGAPGPAPPETLRRGLKVRREDPKPAVVRVNQSPGADILVTEIVLTHK